MDQWLQLCPRRCRRWPGRGALWPSRPSEDGGGPRRWRREWLPQVEALARRLETFQPSAVPAGAWEATLAAQGAEYQRVFAGVHRTAVMTACMAVDCFLGAFVERFGEERRPDALALLQGFPNLSLERATALWDLSRLLRADDALRQALDRSAGLTSELPAASGFREGLAVFLQRFGHTTNNGTQDLLTWAEDPALPLALIRGYARQEDAQSPRAAAARQRERRLELEGELHAQAEADASVAALLPLLEMAQQFLPNLEDHNLLADQRSTAASRARWLAIGRHLQEHGALASPDDVFSYTHPELIGALEGGEPLPQEEIVERQALLAAYRASPPPRVLWGMPASPGSHRGRARLIESLNEASRLREGDVLVCRTTTPPWTPHFGVVGALVTEVGSVLSHGAIVAREFGIPAVVGIMDARAFILDGALVTVDGTSGVVVVETS